MEKIDGISIVVATKGRVKLLGELLSAVKDARDFYEGASEIILVDDSSPEDQRRIAELCVQYDAKLERYTNTVAMKRNHGVEASQYNLILFLDSDCRPIPELLKLHAACYDSEKTGAAAGPLIFTGEENWFWKCVTLTPYLICFRMPMLAETVPWGATANFSVRKEVFEKTGGFSRVFPNKPGGEDVDLGIMITKLGYEIRSVPDGVVYHAKETWSKVGAMYARVWHYGAADYYLTDRHPELCCQVIPRRTVLFALMALIFIVAAVFRSPWLLLGIPLWAALDIVVMAAIMSRFGFQRSTLARQCVVQTLIIWNELGYLANCLRHRKPSCFNRQIIYFENQLKGTMTNGHITFWRFLICYLLTLLLALCAIRTGFIP